MSINDNILMHTSAIVRPVPAYIAHTPYIRCKHYVFLYVCMMNYGQTSGFPETLGFIRPIGTGALWSRSGRKPFGAFRQPKLSVFGPYTAPSALGRQKSFALVNFRTFHVHTYTVSRHQCTGP